MTPKNVKLIVFILLLIHGIGHFQGVAASLGIKINNTQASQSWLIKSWSDRSNKSICLVLFLLTGITGILAALGFQHILLPGSWQLFASLTAVLSTLCLILFPNGFALFFNKIGAISVNMFLWYSVVFGQNWPAVVFED